MTTPDRDSVHARSFGAAAAAYERGRPPYPREAVDWLLPSGARRVLDLGAGTGKLTRALAGRGLETTAVEPSAGMREQLARAVPGVTVLEGTAEHIPLPDGSVDAVLVAQAWHWVDTARAVPEAARVLAPGGTLGLVWNARDEREDWVARLGRILAVEDRAPTVGAGVAGVTAPFGPVEHHTVTWSDTLTPDGLLDLVASRSHVIVLPGAEREALLAEVRDLLATHPDLAGASRVRLPYVTRCHRFRLTSHQGAA